MAAAMRGRKDLHEVFWTSRSLPGAEYCTVKGTSFGWTLKGTIARAAGTKMAAVVYSIRVDQSWKTQAAHLEVLLDGVHSTLDIEAKRGRWFAQGRERTELAGCVDVDLEASPVTNTLPLKRTGLKVGSTVELTTAWIRFPSLRVVTLKQSYERAGRARYVYRSKTGFTAEILTDPFGLVRRYGDYWSAG